MNGKKSIYQTSKHQNIRPSAIQHEKEEKNMDIIKQHHATHMISATRVTDEFYENYYWVEPEELVTIF